MSNPPLPIEIFDVLRAARWRRVKEIWLDAKPVRKKKRFRSWTDVSIHFGVAFDPNEMHYFWRRMLGQKEE